MSDNIDTTKSRAERFAEYERLEAERKRLEVEASAQRQEDAANSRLEQTANVVLDALDRFCQPGVTVDPRVSCAYSATVDAYELKVGEFEASLSCDGEQALVYPAGKQWSDLGRILKDNNISNLYRGTSAESFYLTSEKLASVLSGNSESIYADFCGEELEAPVSPASYSRQRIGGQDYIYLPGADVAFGKNNYTDHVRPFLIATTEVTREQMQNYITEMAAATHALIGLDGEGRAKILARDTEAVIESMDLVAAKAKDPDVVQVIRRRVVPEKGSFETMNNLLWEQPPLNHPAVGVSWEDALGYADYMSRKTGRKVRLLTEAEWEYAARAGGSFKYATATGLLDHDSAQYNTFICAPVGHFLPNAFGLYDMTGNVAEWTSGYYSDDTHVARGGSWNDEEADMSVFSREIFSTAVSTIGFRLAIEVPEETP